MNKMAEFKENVVLDLKVIYVSVITLKVMISTIKLLIVAVFMLLSRRNIEFI